MSWQQLSFEFLHQTNGPAAAAVVDGVGVGELRAPVLMKTPGNEREEEGQVGLLRRFFSESWAIRSLRNLYLGRPTMA